MTKQVDDHRRLFRWSLVAAIAGPVIMVATSLYGTITVDARRAQQLEDLTKTVEQNRQQQDRNVENLRDDIKAVHDSIDALTLRFVSGPRAGGASADHPPLPK